MAEDIDVTKLNLNEAVDLEVTSAAEDEFSFDFPHDAAVLIVNYAGADEGTADITIPAGGDVAWQKDNQEYVPLEKTISNGEAVAIILESAKYKQDNGTVTVEIGGDITGNEDELEFYVVSFPMGIETHED